MTKVSKSERKYGKKVVEEKTEEEEDMYKILIDGSGFTKAMTYTNAKKLIGKYERDAKRLNRMIPSLILVKQ